MMQTGMMQHPPTYWRVITLHPEDDQARLAYADWLDQRCDPLGEFIRVQCDLARAPADRQLAWELERREQELLAEFEPAWTEPIAHLVDWCVFRRGFIAEAGMSAAGFMRHAAEVFQHACLQELHVRDAADCLGGFLRSPLLAGLRHLDLSNNAIRDGGARLLAQCPHLGQLTSLNLSSAAIGNLGATALAGALQLTGLRELYLCDNRIGATGARALAESPLGRQLRVLHIRFNDFGPESRRVLEQAIGDRVRM